MRWQRSEQTAAIPMRSVGPVKIIGSEVNAEVMVPLATFETPLWPSTHRGAVVTRHAGGIRAIVIDERMTRSILLEADTIVLAHETVAAILRYKETMQAIIAETSRFAYLLDMHSQLVGNLIYLRFEYRTGDAAGHNMVTLATDRLLTWIMERFPHLKYVSISGNYCSDKKAGAVNGILGRGKHVITEVTISEELCRQFLKSTPEKIVQLNIKKNLLGNIVAGSIRTANAHFANMLLGFYLATGQDAANIIEGSQGIVHAEVKNTDLYFTVTLPNIIVGTVGNGKTHGFVRDNLQALGCLEARLPGQNARRLAIIAASAVLCGELSLLAAQTNPGELMKSHIKLERQQAKRGAELCLK
ncbi:MAG: hydroxymethylglutaryl-CoA reductase [Gammaproteobacteria bacterium]|nr:hydroxymethylglutaryl-CoA reductase [Gammaproteobacteria bacterium]